jgi:chromosome segregation ATPase
VHVLTKIFIVLVSLLAVMLVPLVVVYAHNEDSFKARFQQAELQASAARTASEAAQLRLSNAVVEHQAAKEKLALEANGLQRERDQHAAEVRRLESELADARMLQTEIHTNLTTLASSVDAGQQLLDSLIGELRSLRTTALQSERKVVELEDVNRDIAAQLQVAVAARRALEEELQRLKDEQAQAMATIAVARENGFLPEVATTAFSGIAPDRTLTTSVVEVRQNDEQTLVEINAGSRDGVKEGWRMTVSRGADFVANIQIIEVDINRSIGKVVLDNPSIGAVRSGDVCWAAAGR